LFERSHSQDGAGDTLSNSDSPSLRALDVAYVENPPPALDADQWEEGNFLYWAEVKTMVQLVKVGRKYAKVRVPGDRKVQSVLIEDLGEK
jgi:hypothetical protein